MPDFPIRVRWSNDAEALTKVVSREIEPLEGTPPEQRDTYTDDDLDTIASCLVGRSKTHVVVEDEDELELVVGLLRRHVNGIGHPTFGGTWSNRTLSKAVERRIDALEGAR